MSSSVHRTCLAFSLRQKYSTVLCASHLIWALARAAAACPFVPKFLLINLMLCSTFQFPVSVLWICESDCRVWDPDPARSAWWETVGLAASPAKVARSCKKKAHWLAEVHRKRGVCGLPVVPTGLAAYFLECQHYGAIKRCGTQHVCLLRGQLIHIVPRGWRAA